MIDQNNIEKYMIEEVQGDMLNKQMPIKDNREFSSHKRKKMNKIIEDEFTSMVEVGNLHAKI